jgi:Uri superfamily endonuclease
MIFIHQQLSPPHHHIFFLLAAQKLESLKAVGMLSSAHHLASLITDKLTLVKTTGRTHCRAIKHLALATHPPRTLHMMLLVMSH